jgi:MoaA/NifB/PqqE/SkfB family radical SAM enzyme
MGALAQVKRHVRQLLLFRLRWLKAYEALLAVEHAVFGRRVGLETCSRCQLACPLCPTAHLQDDWRRDHPQVIGRGALSLEGFRTFVARTPRLRKIELSNWGEIFLNKDLVPILEHAHARGIAVEASNGVNLNAASEEMLEAVVKYGVRHLLVSIDGATPETYKIYRRNGELARVLHNVDRINHYKAVHRSELPRLTWRMIVFGHNEHEIPQARAMAAQRGMRFVPLMNLDDRFSPVKDAAYVERETGIRVQRDLGQALEHLGQQADYCSQMWDSPQINWDGKLLGCCCNEMGDYGNVFELGLDAALRGERYTYAKRMLLGLVPARDDIPCTTCPIYRGTPFVRRDPDARPPAAR